MAISKARVLRNVARVITDYNRKKSAEARRQGQAAAESHTESTQPEPSANGGGK